MAVVCQCDWITDDAVRVAVRDGARTVDEVTAACRAGRDCGTCHDTIEELVETLVGTMVELPASSAA